MCVGLLFATGTGASQPACLPIRSRLLLSGRQSRREVSRDRLGDHKGRSTKVDLGWVKDVQARSAVSAGRVRKKLLQ